MERSDSPVVVETAYGERFRLSRYWRTRITIEDSHESYRTQILPIRIADGRTALVEINCAKCGVWFPTEGKEDNVRDQCSVGDLICAHCGAGEWTTTLVGWRDNQGADHWCQDDTQKSQR